MVVKTRKVVTPAGIVRREPRPGDTETPDTETPETETPENGKPKRAYSKQVLAEVPLDALDASRVPEEEWGSHPLNTAAVRSPAQVKVDETVKALHQEWKDAGSPAERQSPRGRYTVSPEHAPSVRAMLTRAGTHLDVHVKIGPPVHDQDGNERIVFTARDRVRKPRSTADTPVIAAISE